MKVTAQTKIGTIIKHKKSGHEVLIIGKENNGFIVRNSIGAESLITWHNISFYEVE